MDRTVRGMPNLSFFACAHAQDNTITGLKMTHVCSLVAALFVPLLNLSLFASGAHAQEIKECQLKLAFLPSDQHSIGLGAKRFAELVAEKTAGKIKIRSFPGGALGGDLSVISALQGGTIEMTIVVTSNLAGAAKDFSLLDTPYLFNDEREADAILDGPVGERLLAKLPEKGLIGLGYFEFGFRNFLNSRRPILTAEDLKGLKIRVTQAPVYIDFISALGANPTPLGTDAEISDTFGSSTLKAFCPVHSSKLHHLFSRLSLAFQNSTPPWSKVQWTEWIRR